MEERVHEYLGHKGMQEVAHEGVQEQVQEDQGDDIEEEEIAAVDNIMGFPEDGIRFVKGKVNKNIKKIIPGNQQLISNLKVRGKGA